MIQIKKIIVIFCQYGSQLNKSCLLKTEIFSINKKEMAAHFFAILPRLPNGSISYSKNSCNYHKLNKTSKCWL